MKWWVWMIVGVFVFAVTSLIGWSMYKREKGNNADSLEKARKAKEEKRLERELEQQDPEPTV